MSLESLKGFHEALVERDDIPDGSVARKLRDLIRTALTRATYVTSIFPESKRTTLPDVHDALVGALPPDIRRLFQLEMQFTITCSDASCGIVSDSRNGLA